MNVSLVPFYASLVWIVRDIVDFFTLLRDKLSLLFKRYLWANR